MPRAPHWLTLGVVELISMAGVDAALAQSVSSGTIEGTIWTATSYQPGEINLNPNSTDFKRISAASNQILNPDLKEPNAWETTASFEREMAANPSA